MPLECIFLQTNRGYNHPNWKSAFDYVRHQKQNNNLSSRHQRVATKGPCAGKGKHIAVKYGKQYVASIVSCPCYNALNFPDEVFKVMMH